jgi:predicted DNA-binding transcriptional regulator AlpA
VKRRNSERRTALDRRRGDRRALPATATAEPAPFATSRTSEDRAFMNTSSLGFDQLRSLTTAIEALATRASVENARAEKATCTVMEAAALLGTTRKGIYALYERGKLPPSIGPGRRLLWRRDDLLQCSRRASSPGRNRR